MRETLVQERKKLFDLNFDILNYNEPKMDKKINISLIIILVIVWY